MDFTEEQIRQIVAEVVSRVTVPSLPPEVCDLCYIRQPRLRILEICRLMYERHLSDSAGGNVSMRMDDKVYITPRYMGERHRWLITPDDIILARVDGTVLEGEADRISREGNAHFGIYRAFPDVGAVIHAHPAYCLAFACAGKDIPPVTAMVEHFQIGRVELVEDAPPGSEQLAENVIEAFRRRRAESPQRALAALMPKHGILVAGRDISEAYVLLESIETNARTVLMSKLLG